MLKKSITYVDYNGVERTEDFYFNLNKAETLGYIIGFEGGIESFIEKVVQEEDVKKLWDLWSDFILMCYGEKSSDGRRFIKSKELSEGFKQTEAYNNLVMELVSGKGADNAKFVNAVVADVEKDPNKKALIESFKVVE
jgi:hypothetical protein|nr:MAG TPA: hypothetical protein [Caudoviricetes sp.]DAO87341.1 MAG TPA: hypothetical protein [Caudoviricetes sp.]